MSKLFFLLALVVLAFANAKLSTLVQEEITNFNKGYVKKIDVLIMMKQQVDFKTLGLSKMTYEQKGVVVLDSLMSVAQTSQKKLVSLLKFMGVEHDTYYVQNCIAVNGLTAEQVLALNNHEDIDIILSNGSFKVPLEALPTKFEDPSVAQIEWNIEFSKASAAWKKNITGRGIVLANADTGIFWEHEGLKPNYRGWNGEKADHSYNWWDGVRSRINPRGNRCGYNVTSPCGRPQSYIECLEFFLAPFDLQRKNPKPELRPAAIGNSYGCPRAEKCEQGTLKQASDALRATGVFMAVSAGNYGSCSSIRDPPSHYESVISVGASGFKTHSIASYSSKGPVTVDGSNRMKPDLTAPGSNVVGPLPGGVSRYGSMSGTSMASPHVNGAVALLWQASKKLWGDVDATQKLLERTCIQQNTSSCSSNGSSPNNVYGYGSIDLLKAVEEALKLN